MARKKPSMLLPELLQKRMILLLFFVYMGVAYFGGIEMGEETTMLGWINIVAWILFGLGYLLIAVFKKETQVRLSAIHLLLLLLLFMFQQWLPSAASLQWLLWGVCFVVFVFNMRYSLTEKNLK